MEKKVKIQITDIKSVIPFLGFIIIFLLFSCTTGGKFLTIANIKTLILQASIVIVAGVGASFVMAHGNLDFSLGGATAISCMAAGLAGTVAPILILPVAIISGILLSLITAVIHTKLHVQAFVVGMCIMILGKGVVQTLSSTINLTAPAYYSNYNKAWFFLLIVAVVFVIGYILMEHTKIGYYNKAIGSNIDAAYLSGVNVNRYKTFAFMK